MRRLKHILVLLLCGLLIIGVSRARGGDGSRNGDSKPSDADDAGGIARTAPRNTGEDDPAFWGHLTEKQQLDAVISLKEFADNVSNQLKRPLRLEESRNFLLYSDLPAIQSGPALTSLDRMYSRLSELFGLPKGQSIWRGKSLIFVFSRLEDYRLYERMIENDDPGNSSAMTHCFGDGMVHTAFYRDPRPLQFEHLLVHESVHGFLHRYRSPARIPSWANEGLADEAAAELVFERFRTRMMLSLSKSAIEKHGNSVGDFFTARHIDGWQYPIAETLTAWMINRDPKRYLEFINGIKDGQAWDESLKRNFQMSPEKLLEEYGKIMGMKGIKIG